MIQDRLRDAARKLRVTPTPLTDYIPLLQEAADALDRQPVAVGDAGTMPGAEGFTMACFKSSDVPLGTSLYVMRAP